ncbi:MAG: hypothetical protein AAFQ82_00735, partial [Myxococcota bacterium]
MLTLCLFSAVLLPASDLDGIWEIQSLGADRTVRIETDGNSLAIHRVMHPEFEGSRYRLDHLYRGTLEGESIRGQLLVKDEELPDFEVLRSFEGSFSGGKLVIDGLPMKRVENATGEEIAMLPTRPRRLKVETQKTKRRYRKRRRRRGVERGKTQATEQAPPTVITQKDESEESGADLYNQILGGGGEENPSMVQVSREIEVPDEGSEALKKGREHYEKGELEAAQEQLEKARELGTGGLTHKYLGLTRFKRGQYAGAKEELNRARR